MECGFWVSLIHPIKHDDPVGDQGTKQNAAEKHDRPHGRPGIRCVVGVTAESSADSAEFGQPETVTSPLPEGSFSDEKLTLVSE